MVRSVGLLSAAAHIGYCKPYGACCNIHYAYIVTKSMM